MSVSARLSVWPAREHARNKALFDGLERLFAVTFVPVDSEATDGFDGRIRFGGETSTGPPSLTFGGAAGETLRASTFACEDSPAVDGRLRGRAFAMTEVSEGGGEAAPRGTVLAAIDGRPAWTAGPDQGRTYWSALLPPEGPASRRLDSDRFVRLLPLIQFLRDVTGYDRAKVPGLRACFLFDDPNLHARSYGFIDFRDLGVHAATHAYHVAFATVPFDAWYASSRAARIFREGAEQLSLTVHGNDHTFCELARPRPQDQLIALLEQAERRLRALEGRTGIRVARVMVPPHGECGEAAYDALARVGFDALCRAPGWWLEWSPERQAAAGLAIADLPEVGLPIIVRHALSAPTLELDLVVAAYLDQPLIPYGHHYDLADGYDILADVAQTIRTLGDVEWTNLDRIRASNVVWDVHGEEMTVRPFSRTVTVNVPAGVRRLVVQLPWQPRFEESVEMRAKRGVLEVSRPGANAAIDEPVPGPLTIRVVTRSSEPPPDIYRPGAYAPLRRIVTEARDRSLPALRVVRRNVRR